MKLPIYTRDAQGLVTYHGVEIWDNRAQCLCHYYRDHEDATIGDLSGWSHAVVTWYGDLGIGEVQS